MVKSESENTYDHEYLYWDLLVVDCDDEEYKKLLIEAYKNDKQGDFEEVCERFGKKVNTKGILFREIMKRWKDNI